MTTAGYGLKARRSSQTHTWGAAVLLCCTMLANACSDEPPPEPIRLGQAPTSGRQITYSTTLRDTSGHFPFDMWPPACSFLTEVEIKSVFPQARNVRLTPQDRQVQLFWSAEKTTVKDAACAISFDLPGMKPSLAITEESAGIPVKNFPSMWRIPQPNQIAVGDGCAADKASNSVHCQKDLIWFELGGMLGFQNLKPSDDTHSVRYSIDGRVSTFNVKANVTSRDGQEFKTMPELWEFEKRHVTIPLAKLILSKV